MFVLTELEKSYLAGLIDGEGSVTITKRMRWATTGTYQYNLQVIVSNTSLKLLGWLKQKLPGAGSYTHNRFSEAHPHWRLSFTFQLNGKGAWEFLKLIEPYLVIKKEQAVLGIEFGLTKGFQQGLKLSEYILLILDGMRQRMSDLNHSDFIKGGG